jgi:hypothetical protein
MRGSTVLVNVAGFFVGSASISWMILRSPRFAFSSAWLDILFSVPLWPILIVAALLLLLAVGRGKLAIGLIVGALLSFGLILILAMAALAEA